MLHKPDCAQVTTLSAQDTNLSVRSIAPQPGKSRPGPIALREVGLVCGETGTEEVMGKVEAISIHLFPRLLCRPTLFCHSPDSDHQAGAIITRPAMNKDSLAGMVTNHRQELNDYAVLWVEAVPGNLDVFHAQLCRQLTLLFSRASAGVNDYADAHPPELLKALERGLPAAIERGRDLAEVRKTRIHKLARGKVVNPRRIIGTRSCPADAWSKEAERKSDGNCNSGSLSHHNLRNLDAGRSDLGGLE
jgi:hypothetical protein